MHAGRALRIAALLALLAFAGAPWSHPLGHAHARETGDAARTATHSHPDVHGAGACALCLTRTSARDVLRSSVPRTCQVPPLGRRALRAPGDARLPAVRALARLAPRAPPRFA